MLVNGYVIEKVGDFWRLRCRGKLLPEQYSSKDDAVEAAKKKDPCRKVEKPKLTNDPITNPDGGKKPNRPKP